MVHVSTKRRLLLVWLSVLLSATCADCAEWPVKGQIDLSSGFGDYRSNRFHAGFDLRTGGRVGEKIYSPVDGHVWRVRMSYDGYGKGLYVKGNDGRLYVYGHLSAFAAPISRVVRQAQFAAERYYVDLYFPSDSIVVKQGELIGLTGETGAGAPHLHFEVRSGNNRPLNPLAAGFALSDKTRPTFKKISFQLVDDHSLFPNGTRRIDLPVKVARQEGYSLDTVLSFDSPFGILTECTDQTRLGGMRQGVYKLTLEIDGRVYYQSVFDSLDFDWGPSASLEYDLIEASNGNERVRRLFHRQGNRFPGSGSHNRDDGLFGRDSSATFGLHTGVIRAEDFAGNSTELKFRFLWTPEGGPLYPDTTTAADRRNADWFFGPRPGAELIGIDSVRTEFLVAKRWRTCRDCQVVRLDDGRYRVRIAHPEAGAQLARLVINTHSGCILRGPMFEVGSGTEADSTGLTLAVQDDGIVVSTIASGTNTGQAQVSLFKGDTLAGTETTGYHSDGVRQYMFIPPKPEYRRITSLAWLFPQPSVDARPQTLDVCLAAVGYGQGDTVRVDDRFAVITGPSTFYSPRFVALARRDSAGLSRVYEISPRAFVTQEPFTVELITGSAETRAGLCWQDRKARGWVWINADSTRRGVAWGESRGGGRFAVLVDTVPPRVSRLNIKEGMTLQNLSPKVTCQVLDNLSGIQDDLSFDIRINGRWLVPEYDFERGTLVAELDSPLEPGKCSLSIVVVDRAGNKTELQRSFTVSTGKQARQSK
jgi:hypothetical protein